MEDVEGMFDASRTDEWIPSYNAGPTGLFPVITCKKPARIQLAYWGLPSKMANDKPVSPRLFNLSAQQAFQRPVYRKALQHNRVIIPADGFYIWKQVSKKQKVPYFCHYAHHSLFAIAAICEEYEDMDGNSLLTFNMITLPADDQLSAYQEDMPALLNPDSWKKWIDPNSSQELISHLLNSSTSGRIQMHAVSPLISDAKKNNATLIKPSMPSDQFGNYTLFS